MKSVCIVLLSITPFFYSPLGAPSTQDVDDEAFFAQHMSKLIETVKSKKESKKYKNEDMNSFLMVAMALKNGIPDETKKDIPLALELLDIVQKTSTNESLRISAENGIKNILQNIAEKPR